MKEKKLKIIVAILGGALVGGLGACGVIWPGYGMIFAAASGLVTLIVATYTGLIVPPKS